MLTILPIPNFTLRILALFIPLFWGLSSANGIAAAESRPEKSSDPNIQMIMFERDGCEWCERWDADIATAYPNTWEGKTAPLHRVDIHGPKPSGLDHLRWPRYTPVFVLMVDGQEKGRLRGYAGADFFWPLWNEVLTNAGLREPSKK